MASKTAPRSPIVTALIWAAVAAVALVTALAAAADRFWIGDMITFFRPQLALAVLLVLCAAIWLRRFGASAALAALLVVNALPLFTISVPTAASADTPDMRIVSANVLFDHPSPARFAEVIAKLSPDIIVTQEAKFKWPDVLRALPDFPYLVGPEISKWNGNLVLSRYPLRARLVPDMPPSGYSLGGGYAVRVEVDLPDRAQPLVIYAIHAPTPRTLCRLAGAQPLSRRARRTDCRRTDGHADRACGRLEHAGLVAGLRTHASTVGAGSDRAIRVAAADENFRRRRRRESRHADRPFRGVRGASRSPIFSPAPTSAPITCRWWPTSNCPDPEARPARPERRHRLFEMADARRPEDHRRHARA